MQDPESPDLIRIGRIGRPHGVNGAVTINLDDPDSSSLPHLDELLIRHRDGSITRHDLVSLLWFRKGCAGVLLAGIGGREQAARLTNGEALVERSALDLQPADLLVSDLPGLEVVCDGAMVGRVKSTYHNGVHDVMVIETEVGFVDFPVTETHVRGLDGQGRLMVEEFEGYRELAYGSDSRRGR